MRAPLLLLLPLAACAAPSGTVELAARPPCGTVWGTAPAGEPETLHVAPWGEDGAEGDRDRPLRRIGEAVARARQGGERIVLAGGTHPGPVVWDGPGALTVIGACREGAVVKAPDPLRDRKKARQAARAGGGTLRLQDLTLEGGERTAEAHGEARLELVRVTARAGTGSTVAVRNQARLVGEDLQIEDAVGVGLYLGRHGRADLVDSRIVGGRAGEGSAGGVRSVCGDLWAVGLHIEDVPHYGIRLEKSGASCRSHVDLEDLVVLNPRPGPNAAYGDGLSFKGVTGELRGATVQGAAGSGIALMAGADLRLFDVTVRDTRPGRPFGSGRGLSALGSTTRVEGERVELLDNGATGLTVWNQATVELRDSRLAGNRFAGAVLVEGALTLDRALVEQNGVHPEQGGGVGLYVGDRRANLVVRDSELGDHPGPALYAKHARQLRLERLLVRAGGSSPARPGGVYAGADPARLPVRVEVIDSTFEDLAGGALLLDGAGATLAGNTFRRVGGPPLRVQRCFEGMPEVELEAGSPLDRSCAELFADTLPRLDFTIGAELEEPPLEEF